MKALSVNAGLIGWRGLLVSILHLIVGPDCLAIVDHSSKAEPCLPDLVYQQPLASKVNDYRVSIVEGEGRHMNEDLANYR